MRHGKLTREEAIELVGGEYVDRVERENCEPTSRLQTDGDTDTEWSASVEIPAALTDNIGGSRLTLYYYTTEDDAKNAQEYGSWDCVDWDDAKEGYEIE